MTEHLTALLSRHTQTTRLLRLTTPLGPHELLAECVRGEEGLSQAYTFSISALSLDAGISLRSLLGQPALLELLTVREGERRPFHGHITQVEFNGANGGMARYTLTLQPWTVFLGRARDSRVFQDKSVIDILDTVFGNWHGRGTLEPAWRFDIVERSVYPTRSLVTQYQESDWAFVERLMSEEGLFYYFEHEADAATPSLGVHRLVIADHNGAFQPNTQSSVRYTQPGAVMKEDSLDRWRKEVRLHTNAVELRSWDYRTRENRHVVAQATQEGSVALVSRDFPGQYAYASGSDGQRIADRQLEAFEARREGFVGAGTVRTLAPGTTFSLAGHAVHDLEASDDRTFLVTRVLHLMHNNLHADLATHVHKNLAEGSVGATIAAELAKSLHAVGNGPGERPLYRNRIDAIRARIPYRASRVDEHGCLLHPRPTVQGQQSAIVVGPAGSVIHTDRDHRVKVQFHWQRGAQSHNRLDHPAPEGHSGAPADDTAGTWVRVATPLAPVAGANWGTHALPRVGQEVLVDFLNGNIDRPVIIGALFNGAGEKDAPYNQHSQGAGAATGNAPMWFAGEAGAHAHPAVLSGLKSQAMQASQKGSGGYSQLVFDDSPQQARVALQRHADMHAGTDELNLGHLAHQVDNERKGNVGFGAELKSEHGIALRAGQGLLVSSDARDDGGQLDVTDAQAQVAASHELQVSLTKTAQQHNAGLKSKDGKAEAAPEELVPISQMDDTAKVLASSDTGAQGDGPAVRAFSKPHLQLSSPSGIALTTPGSTIVTAGVSTSVSAGHDLNFAAQGNSVHVTAAGISLFSYGKAIAAGKPNQESGIRLHAGSGKVSSNSNSGPTRITADKAVTVASVSRSVSTAGKSHVSMTAQGALLKLVGADIMLHAPGKVEFKAGSKELSGPKSANAEERTLPRSEFKGCTQATSDASGRQAGVQLL